MAEGKSPPRKRFGLTEVLLIVGIVVFSGFTLTSTDVSLPLKGIIADAQKFLLGFYFY